MKNYASLILSIICVLCFSCSKTTNNNQQETDIDSVLCEEELETPDVEIALKTSNTKTSLQPDEPDLYFVGEKNSSEYRIFPVGRYCELTDNTKRTVAMNNYDPTCYNEFPILTCYIVNNSDQSLDISSLKVEVKKSELDRKTLIYITTETDQSNTITFLNDGWGHWDKGRLEYSIMKRGEQFDGNYSSSRDFDFFSDKTRINFLNDLIAMGYDFDRACQEGEWIQEESSAYLFFSASEDSNLFAPFDSGYARLYGKLVLDNGYTKDFKANISMCVGDLGAGCDEDDSFDIRFKTDGSDY